MADKLKQGVNVITTFVEGETPSAAKLNSITAQLRNASQQLEKAVGDIHNQSYPYSGATADNLSIAYGRTDELTAVAGAGTRPLDIANIARLIGPASALNPMLLEGTLSVTEDVPADVNEFSLNYPPEDPSTVSFTDTTVFFNRRLALADMVGIGDYHVDAEGRVYSARPTSSTPSTVTYTVDRESLNGGSQYLGSRFNVIPGPNQLAAGGNGCTAAPPAADGSRVISTPTLSHAQFNEDLDAAALADEDPNFGEQIKLPAAITSGAYAPGETIPEGFVYLKNWTTNEVYDTATYSYVNATSVLFSGVDITTEVDRGDVFALITVGTDITTSIDDLRRKMRHSHDRNFGEPLVPVASLGDACAGPWVETGTTTAAPPFTKSLMSGNFAPQYLHRYGYDAAETPFNDDNVMRGDFVVGKEGASAGAGVAASTGALTLNTYKVAFGHPDRTYIREEPAAGLVVQVNQSDMRANVAAGSLTNFVRDDITNTALTGDYTVGVNQGNTSFNNEDGAYTVRTHGDGSSATRNNMMTFEIDGGENPMVFANKSNSAGVNGEGGRIYHFGRGMHFHTMSAVLSADPEDLYQTLLGNFGASASRDFSIEVAGGASDTVCRAAIALADSYSDGYGLLELNSMNASTSNFRYLEFKDNLPGTILGCVRGVNATSEKIFVARDGATQAWAVWALPASSSTHTDITPSAVGASTTRFVRYESGGADYGEWLCCGDIAEWTDYRDYNSDITDRMGLPEGLIVYVREGKFWRSGSGTPMVVTQSAMVVGNMKEGEHDPICCEVLSFIGQIQVATLGPVKSGDYLIPSADDPNLAVAVDPDECTFAQYRSAVGTAWASNDSEELKLVLCAIGKK